MQLTQTAATPSTRMFRISDRGYTGAGVNQFCAFWAGLWRSWLKVFEH